ncbi:MAG: Glycosyl transferase, partial [uncultured bacterium]
MVTIFATPKAFKGPFAIIQENAIASWAKLKPKCQIILLGNDYGTEKIAKKYGALHIPNVEVTKLGTPLLPDIFKKAYEKAEYPIMAYVNCDMILMSDFIKAIKLINLPIFFLTGSRRDLAVESKLEFKNNWQRKLKSEFIKSEKFKRYGATDYFIFTPKIDFQMPNLIVGRTWWDAWLIYRAKYFKMPIIDATEVIWAIHQEHDYSHAGGWKKVWTGPESKINIKLIGG